MFTLNGVRNALFGQPDPLVSIREYMADGVEQRSITITQSGNAVVNGSRVGAIDTSLIQNLIVTCDLYGKRDRYGDSLSPQHFAKIVVNTKRGQKEIHAEDSMPVDLPNFIAGVKTVVRAGSSQYANLGF